MLEQLFGSRTRFKLLKHFFQNPDKVSFVRELSRRLDEQLNSIRRELANLEKLGIIEQKEVVVDEGDKDQLDRHKYYGINKKFILYTELKNLILKANLLLERTLRENIEKVGSKVKYLALTGIFIGQPDAQTDMLVIGNFNKDKLRAFINRIVKSFDQDVRYTVLNFQEYEYRKNVADKFLCDVLENSSNIVVIDRL